MHGGTNVQFYKTPLISPPRQYRSPSECLLKCTAVTVTIFKREAFGMQILFISSSLFVVLPVPFVVICVCSCLQSYSCTVQMQVYWISNITYCV